MAKHLLSAFLLGTTLSAVASEVEFSYNATGMDPTGYGFKKEQTYDVGIALNSPQMIGKEIVSLSVPVFDTDYLSAPSVWLSKELTASKGSDSKFTPDIASYDVAFSEGMITFAFPEAYTIPEEGVFIGYSFTVSGLPEGVSINPIAVADGNIPGGLWLHSTVTQKRWADLSVRNNIVSDISVTLKGDFLQNAAAISSNSGHIYAAKGEESEVEVTIENWGDKEIASFDYVYSLDGSDVEGKYVFNTPIPSSLGSKATATLEIIPLNEIGEYTYDLRLTKVNGVDNEYESSPVSLPLTVQPFLAVYRPLMEEYTGFNCGWCPKGYVMLEQMKLYYGDQFVALSYHTYGLDGLTFVEEGPLRPSGFPSAAFNRGSQIGIEDAEALWKKNYRNNTTADVEVTLEWTDEAHTKLTAKARTRFVSDVTESPYVFSIALVGDGLSNEAWAQNNSYDDYEATGEYTGPYWDLFIGNPSPVKGLTYNDVVLHYTDFNGIAGSLPSEINAEQWYEYSYEFDIASIRNWAGEDVVNDFNKTRAIAIVIDSKTRKPVNCCSSIYPDGTVPSHSGIKAVDDEAAPVIESVYYDLQGHRVINPAKGLFIQVDRLSDGTAKTRKAIF